MNLLPFSRIRCVRPVVLRFLALFPGVFCGVERFRPALWSLPRGDAAITRRKRVASVCAWDGSC